MSPRADIVGKTYGRLTVTGYDSTRSGRGYWQCSCSCGGAAVVATTNLRETARNPVRSCGCLLRDTAKIIGSKTRKHGDAVQRTTEYRTWCNIKIRCHNPNAVNWKYYGEMGVKVCERWVNSFENFLADMGRKPTPKHSIDRYPDPSGDYEPNNCRWATSLEQRHNRRPK